MDSDEWLHPHSQAQGITVESDEYEMMIIFYAL